MRTMRIFMLLCAALVVLLSLASCMGPERSSEPYTGTPTRKTPYDSRYERVRVYLQEARTRIIYTPEDEGQDYWQLPEESEYLGTGDCEDMAIWLYVKLKRKDVGPVRLCIGKHSRTAAQMHAWLVWSDGRRLYVLDPSTSDEPLREDQVRPGSYIPYYSYDGDAKWRHKAAG